MLVRWPIIEGNTTDVSSVFPKHLKNQESHSSVQFSSEDTPLFQGLKLF